MLPNSNTPLKVCTKCNVPYPNTSEYFYRRGQGLRADCKACGSEKAKVRYHANADANCAAARERYYSRREEHLAVVKAWRQANREKVRGYTTKWNKAHPEACQAASTRWREKHPDHSMVASSAYRRKYPEKVKASREKWVEANPEKVRAKWRRHRKNRAGAPGSHTVADERRQRKIQSDLCWYCMKPLNGGGQLDHKEPLSRGGSDYPSNLAWSCVGCNQKKNAKTEAEYITVINDVDEY